MTTPKTPTAPYLEPKEALAVFSLSLVLLFVAGGFVLPGLGLAGIVVGQVCFIAGPAVAFALLRGGTLRRAASLLGVRPARRAAIAGAVLVGISFWYVGETLVWPIAERYLEGPEAVRELEEIMLPAGRPLLVTLVVFAVFPALCEEILLRGALALGLRKSLGFAGAVFVSALFFGLMHVIPAQILTTFTFGIPLAFAALVTGSVIPGVLIHLLNNAISILLAGGALPSLATAIEEKPAVAGLAATALTLAGLVLLWRGRPLPDAEPRSS